MLSHLENELIILRNLENPNIVKLHHFRPDGKFVKKKTGATKTYLPPTI